MSRVSFQGVSDVLHHVFESLLLPLAKGGDASAIVLPEGEALLVSPATPADLATLPHAASLCHKYLKLADGDVAISNDPYSGGTVLSDFTLIVGVKIDPSSSGADLLLARRIRLAPRIVNSGKLDDEGVRVPPTPLKSGRGELNRDLLNAISNHPLAPAGLLDVATGAIEDLIVAAERLRRLARDPGTPLRKANFRVYLDDSARAFEALMTRLPLGTVSNASTLPSGETMKLKILIGEEHVHFDFGGSAVSPRIALTELATFGACVAALAAASDDAMPMNSGTFQHIQVSAPSRTMLSAVAPSGTMRGMREGIAAVSRLAVETLGKLSPTLKTAECPGANACVQAVFADGRIFSAEIPPGSGASAKGAGADAASPWASHGAGFALSLENVEQAFPIRILSAGERAASGGNGAKRGGNGGVLGFELLEAAEVRWMDFATGRRMEGISGGRSSSPGVIELVRVSSGSTAREAVKTVVGSAKLAAGDQVFAMTGGGGGYGEPKDGAED